MTIYQEKVLHTKTDQFNISVCKFYWMWSLFCGKKKVGINVNNVYLRWPLRSKILWKLSSWRLWSPIVISRVLEFHLILKILQWWQYISEKKIENSWTIKKTAANGYSMTMTFCWQKYRVYKKSDKHWNLEFLLILDFHSKWFNTSTNNDMFSFPACSNNSLV